MIREVLLDSLDLIDIEFDKKGNLKETGMIAKKIVCVRPGHKSGLPKIYTEMKGDKIISHNYGHSGTGYCFLFSTVETAIENFEKMCTEKGINNNQKITVIGMGCIGLVTALNLYQKGYKNIEIVGEKFEQTPSFNAGGLFEFSLTATYTDEQKGVMNEHFKRTFDEYKKIVEGKNNFLSTKTVVYIDYYTDFYDEKSGLGYLAELGLIPKGEKVVVSIKNTNNKFNMTHFRTFHIVTNFFMEELMKAVESLKIPLTFKKVNDFREIKSNLIFNCSGLGSFHLNNDKEVQPVCGHGFLLNKKDKSQCNYILRGSYIKDYYGDDEITNEEYFDLIMKRVQFVFQGIKPKF